MYHQTVSAVLTGLLYTTHVMGSNNAADAQPGRVLAARQQSADCTAGISSVLSAFPRGTGDAISYVESALATGTNGGSGGVNPTQLCEAINALPSSQQSEISDYESSVTSWLSAEGSRIDSLVSSCPNDTAVSSLASVTSELSAYASGCNASNSSSSSSAGSGSSNATTTTSGGGGGVGGVGGGGSQSSGTGTSGTTAGAGTQTGTPAGVTGTSGGNAASKDPAFVIGAAAIAGVMGVAVFL
ncbi:hypothetical protein PFICI_01075 [Pestalotiopsis fici W106-1]|uniref:Infection structure specific protein n=1 Tax=Pestalotiopsis fici (strain W106-1 / CGMCC3.15140) TaxID=1229662 RepID=W3XP21_PESFW|nr:uncharacterized protein PFICI_01075 [Pestalotiopsis fici W106-1]ETS87247.1 hypothetical protein PFICI_01075 [Pestalotiopsis fici W106-1]